MQLRPVPPPEVFYYLSRHLQIVVVQQQLGHLQPPEARTSLKLYAGVQYEKFTP